MLLDKKATTYKGINRFKVIHKVIEIPPEAPLKDGKLKRCFIYSSEFYFIVFKEKDILNLFQKLQGQSSVLYSKTKRYPPLLTFHIFQS